MKLQLVQALATILEIQIVPFRQGQPEMIYVTYIGGKDGIQTQVGVVGESSLEQAVWKAMELSNLSAPSNFAVFPIHSNREDYYMAIERELLRQETSAEFNGKFMWQMMGAGDPRELIEMIMLQIREAAQAILHPVSFQEALLRVGCLIISCMQWTSDWIARLRVREAAMRTQVPEEPKVVDFPPPGQGPGNDLPGTVEPVPPLFGVAGLQAVDPPAEHEPRVDRLPSAVEETPETERKEDAFKPDPVPPSKGPGNGKRKRNRKRNR